MISHFLHYLMSIVFFKKKAVDVIKDVVVDRQSSRSVTVSPTYP